MEQNVDNVEDVKTTELEQNDEKMEDAKVTETIKENIKVETIQEQKKPKVIQATPKWEPDLHRMICVKNIAKGKLVYKSKRQMGYVLEWEKTDDENYMELVELVNLKNTDKRIIEEPWIKINEPDEVEILKYLGIYKYYEKILDIDNIQSVLQLSPDRFERKFKNLPDSFKEAIAERAAKMIKSGELDSLKIKNIIEKDMDIDLAFYDRGN
jgi:hypothetical protein